MPTERTDQTTKTVKTTKTAKPTERAKEIAKALPVGTSLLPRAFVGRREEPQRLAGVVYGDTDSVMTLSNQAVVMRDVFTSSEPLRKQRFRLRFAPLDMRRRLEREGVPAHVARAVEKALGLQATQFQVMTGIAPTTYKRKLKEPKTSRFTGLDGLAIVGAIDLVNDIEAIVPEDAVSDQQFDAEKWLGDWIDRPQKALGGRKPIELMDTPSGRQEVRRVLGAIASGAYL